jgi:predicted nucleic acid-binding protein
VLYFDASAIVKLVRTEAESDALRTFIVDHPDDQVAWSELVSTETARAVRPGGSKKGADARCLLQYFDLKPLTRDLLDEAADVGPDLLRSLDAIHLATALRLRRGLTALVAYDARLLDAARAAGLRTASPGSG